MPKVYTIMFFASIALTVAAIVVFAMYGLNLGVDFKGGSIMELEFSNRVPPVEDVHRFLKAVLPSEEFNFSESGEKGMVIRSGNLSEEAHRAVLNVFKENYPDEKAEEKRFDSVGPVIGNELKNKSVTAIIVVLAAITFYIAMVFRKMSVVISPWVMGVAAMLALAHDVMIPLGVFAVLGHFYNVEISAVFVAAILTILGFSVSDTVVIFDRIRENVIRNRVRENFGHIVHTSVMQTLTRSLNTTFTVLLSLFAIYFFGGESLKYFSLALIIGIFVGAYSSIFVASPLLVWWSDWTKSRR